MDGATGAGLRDLAVEAEAVRWFHREVRERRMLHVPEAEAVVHSLHVLMHGEGALVVPLLRSDDPADYATVHGLNVAMLAMALGEWLGNKDTDVRSLGLAGLLSDLGSILLPPDLLAKQGELSPDEREQVRAHVLEGARLLVESDEPLQLAAVVAYEHHLSVDGAGYPSLVFDRGTHYATRLVRICDVFDALTTPRPFRAAWSMERALGHIEERAGSEFDAELVDAFARNVRALGERLRILPSEDAPVF